MTNMYNSYIHTLKFLKFKIKLIIAQDTRFIISFIYNILFITTRCYQHRKIPCPFRILTLRFIFYFIQSHHMMYVSHLVNDNCFIHILKDHIYFASWHWWSRLFHSHLSTEKKIYFASWQCVQSFISSTYSSTWMVLSEISYFKRIIAEPSLRVFKGSVCESFRRDV